MKIQLKSKVGILKIYTREKGKAGTLYINILKFHFLGPFIKLKVVKGDCDVIAINEVEIIDKIRWYHENIKHFVLC